MWSQSPEYIVVRKTNSELTDCRRFADFEVNTIML